MPSIRQQRGGSYERRAIFFLRRRGWRILATHVTCRYGELDIVAQDGETIVAVEVKGRRSSTFGSSCESLTKQKYLRLVRALQYYLHATHQDQAPHRLDLIAIDGSLLRHVIGACPAPQWKIEM